MSQFRFNSLVIVLLGIFSFLPSALAEARKPDVAATDTTKQSDVLGSSDRGEIDDNSPTQAQSPLAHLENIKRLRVAGSLLSEAPLRVGELDVLAPMVPLMSKLGANVTRVAPANIPGNLNTPTENEYFQINLPQGAPLVLTLGRASVFINGIEQPLRAAPLVIGGKIWLPVFSLAPLLGAAARLENDGTLNLYPTVQSVELFPIQGRLALTVKTSAPFPPDRVLVGHTDNPLTIYIDFPGYSMGFDAAGSLAERVVSSGLGNVRQVRAGLYQKSPDTTRIVLDLKQPLKSVPQRLPDQTIFALLLEPQNGTLPPDPSLSVTSIPQTGSLRGLTIVLDAGHGGHDSGAPGAKSLEKTQTLDIVRRLRKQLTARGATVLLTRDGDYFVSLQARADFANSRRADIFFSVHINSFQPNSSGTETFYWSAPSQFLAREVQNELVKATGLRSRGVSQARFYVIRHAQMPAVLTESCFISNAREEALLLKPEFRERIAGGMAQGITNYAVRFLKRTVDFSTKTR